MPKNYTHFLKFLYIFGDFIALNIAFAIAYFLKYVTFVGFFDEGQIVLLAYINIVWILVIFLARTYKIPRIDEYRATLPNSLRALAWHFAAVTTFLALTRIYDFSRIQLIAFYLILVILVIIWKFVAVYLAKIYRKLGFHYINVIIIGNDKPSYNFYQFINKNKQAGYRFMGFFANKSENNSLVKGNLAEVESYILRNDIDEIFCSLEYIDKKYLRSLTKFADTHLKRIKLLPNLKDFYQANTILENYGEIPVILTRDEPLNDQVNLVVKRAFDIVFSSLVIVLVFSWLFPLIALAIKLTSKGPIFFNQKRNGKDNHEFNCLKFRTMRYEPNADFVQATQNDNRITRIGAFLRKTSLDEFPQFLNVFWGDMTVVGPRPHPLALNDTFKHVVEKYMVRHLVKPGVTGLAQVKGYRGETKDVRSMINRVKMDIFYIENWSFFLDLKIILWTISSVMKGDKNAF